MDKKKMAAIMTVVNQYMAKKENDLVESIHQRSSFTTFWAVDGRRHAMDMRNLWQLRIFKRTS